MSLVGLGADGASGGVAVSMSVVLPVWSAARVPSWLSRLRSEEICARICERSVELRPLLASWRR
jgi:hypothetical protein